MPEQMSYKGRRNLALNGVAFLSLRKQHFKEVFMKHRVKSILFIGLALIALFGMTACPNNAGGGGSGGGTPTPVYTKVAYGMGGADLQAWLTNNAAAAPAVNYIELAGVTRDHLSGSVGNPSPLGKIIQDSGKKVALKLPAAITKIGPNAFDKCTALTGIDLSACTGFWGGAKIYGDAFAKCTELKTVTFGGARVPEIGQFAFAGCTALSSVDLSGCPNLEKIDMWAFQDCTALKELRLPQSLTVIGTDAFKDCSIETLVIHCDIKGTIIENFTKKDEVKANLKKLTLGEGVTTIGKDAFNFSGYSKIEAVDFSACTTLTEIGKNAFAYANDLTNVNLSDCTSLTTIGKSAFSDCTDLTDIDLSGCTALKKILEEAFNSCYTATVKLPTGITEIEHWAFGENDENYLCKNVLIPSSHAATIRPLVTGSDYPEDRIREY